MLSRRIFMAGGVSATLLPRSALTRAPFSNETFADALAATLGKPELLASGRSDREGLAAEYDEHFTRAIAPRDAPSSRALSDDAMSMIVSFEVTSPTLYAARYERPIWPRGQSGVTVGVGYDAGYVTRAWLAEDWATILSPTDIARLSTTCGVTGPAAAKLIAGVRPVRIGWTDAYRQFSTTCLPRYTAEVLRVLPNAKLLSQDCLGALVSLVYNRGPSFRLVGDRYTEMNDIRLYMVRKEFDKIPERLSHMGRLWRGHADPAKNLPGLVARRKLEALLFQRGLASI